MVVNRYEQIIDWIFHKHYSEGMMSVPFQRNELEDASRALGFETPKNLGDVIYSIRFRCLMPESVSRCAPEGREWVIRGAGKARYAFELVKKVRIVPNETMIVTKVPDSTPEIISAAAQGDEQALLALVRYNKLVDIFLGVAAYSLQNHLRTTAEGIGQVEIDEVYVAVDRHGQQYIIPVQAKGHTDEIGVTQPEQDLAVCKEKWPDMVARALAVQFMEDGVIALFELARQDGCIRVVREAHYKLVPHGDITQEDRDLYKNAARNSTEIFEL
ncbi:endonuclease [Gordonibacter sp. An230]|uniref:endonuclease n=1 Tax=Gordonibacter sp. An230 TaxID=1965592 RepID=UPI000B3A75BE|nr:endonuclease [Gordonibacter sp. An230]OUO88984.1 endonuclease [Gordonibacter sp. An230]